MSDDSVSRRSPQSQGPVARRLGRRGRNLLFGAVLLTLAFSLAELGARAFYRFAHDLSFFQPDLESRFYPPTRRLMRESIHRDDEVFDVLLLGGSVLHPRFGRVAEELEESLRSLPRPIRIHNVSQAAHMSRDSLLKYRMLERQRFDLVVFYHAINEARANYCPPELFRDDYTHMAWYANIQHPMHAEQHASIFAYFVQYQLLRVRLRMNENDFIDQGALREEWIRFGSDLKSIAPFRANLEEILEIARRRGDGVLLSTYAIDAESPHFASWGVLENTIAAVAAHNDVVRDLAERHGVPLVEAYETMPRGQDYFSDICHLTDAGSEALASRVGTAIARIAQARSAE